eukprot:2700512-Alexandrium_andersonii.AAC.1
MPEECAACGAEGCGRRWQIRDPRDMLGEMPPSTPEADVEAFSRRCSLGSEPLERLRVSAGR